MSRAQIDIALAAANVVSSYVSKNAMTFASVPKMIADVHATIVTLIKTSEPIDYAEPASGRTTGRVPHQSTATQSSAEPTPVAAERTAIAQPKIINPAALNAAPSPVKKPADGALPESKSVFQADFVVSEPTKTPVVPIDLSIHTDRIICLVCGKAFATLTRHLKMTHGMSEVEYRAIYGLSPSYPMNCQAFIKSRAALIAGGKFRPSTKAEIAEKRRLLQSTENTASATTDPTRPVPPKAADLEEPMVVTPPSPAAAR